MPLSKSILSTTLSQIEIIYLSGERCRNWNRARRDRTNYDPAVTPCMFAGFYWVNGRSEAGPFRSYSAAVRDAWYNAISGSTPPGYNDIKRFERFEQRRNSK
jgi:hypothetical protein